MKHLFVPYQLAVMVKDAGFDEPCLMFYNNIHYPGKLMPNINGTLNSDCRTSTSDHIISAPLYQQVIDWFREKGIRIVELPTTANPVKWALTAKPEYEFLGGFELDKAIEEAFKLI